MSGFQKKEQELFLKIADDIKRYPNRYRNAGKWLDKYYDDTVFLSKKQKEIEQQKHQLRIEIKRLETEIKSDISTFGDDRGRLEGKLFTRNQRLEFIRQL